MPDPADLLSLLDEVAAAVARALDGLDDWGLAGTRQGQYRHDLAADEAALAVLDRAGVGVLSEETGLHRADHDVLVVVDPVDGSTNASLGIPHYATSLCAMDAEGPLVALIVNQATGERFDAVRGGGARRNGVPIRPSGCEALRAAVVGISGYPARRLGWSQFRSLGAAALDLCYVASGRLDAFADCTHQGLGVWDYLAASLVCAEVGVPVTDVLDRELVVRDPGMRRIPVAAATPALQDELLRARRALNA